MAKAVPEEASALGEASTEKLVHFDFGGQRLRLQTSWSLGIGGGIWSTAEQFAAHLEACAPFYAARFAGRRILELGAGTGLAGFCAALAGQGAAIAGPPGLDEAAMGGRARMAPPAEVVLTDVGDYVPMLRENVALNGELFRARGVAVRVEEYDWAASHDVAHLGPGFDVVIGMDVAFHERLYEDVARAIAATTAEGGIVILGVTRLDTGPSFFRHLAKRGFTYHRVQDHLMAGKHVKSSFALFTVFRPRSIPVPGDPAARPA